MSPVDEYFASLDAATRAAFEHKYEDWQWKSRLRPKAGTSYGMAALIYKKKPLIGFRVSQKHLNVFPSAHKSSSAACLLA